MDNCREQSKVIISQQKKFLMVSISKDAEPTRMERKAKLTTYAVILLRGDTFSGEKGLGQSFE